MKKSFAFFRHIVIVFVLLFQSESTALSMQMPGLDGSPKTTSQSQTPTYQLTFNDFGMNNIHFIDVNGNPASQDMTDVQDRYRASADIGAKWNRWVLWFHLIAPYNDLNQCPQPENIQIDEAAWQNYDNLVSLDHHDTLSNGQDNGTSTAFNSLIVLQGAPRCFQVSPPNSDPANLYSDIFLDNGGQGTKDLATATRINPANYWAYFVYAAVSRYGDKVQYWQVWNEEDITNPDYRYWTLPLEDYARMVEVTYWAAKLASRDAGRSDIKLVLGGFSSFEQSQDTTNGQDVINVLSALNNDTSITQPNYFSYIDVYDLHTYRSPWGAIHRVAWFRSLGYPWKPVWLTETGACDNQVAANQTWEASYEMQFIAYLLAADPSYDIEKFFHFQLVNDNNENCGLLMNDYDSQTHPFHTRKDNYTAYQQLYNYLRDATPRQVNNGSFLFAPDPETESDYLAAHARGRQEVYFSNPAYGNITIAWATVTQPNPDAERITASQNVAASQLIWQDGTPSPLAPTTQSSYSVTLPLRNNNYIGGITTILAESIGTGSTGSNLSASAQISGSGIEVVFQYPFDQSHQLVIQRQESDPLVLATRIRAAAPRKMIIQPWLGIITIPMTPSPQYSYFDQVIVPGHEYCYRSELYQNGVFVGTSNEVCVTAETSTYPYGIQNVSTIPDAIAPLKDLPGLFDGDAVEGDFALINYTPEPVSIVIEFSNPVTLRGFDSTIGGYHDIPDGNTWSIAADDQGNGNFQDLVSGVPSDAGPVRILLPAPHTAKVFKVTTQRLTGDGAVHMSELTPLFVSSAGGGISGVIYESSGGTNVPLAGAYVQVCQIGGRCAVTVSGSNGSYSVGNLEAGQYFITALPPAGQSFIQQRIGPLSVSSGSILTGQDIIFHGPAAPPPGTTITSVGTTAEGLPIIYWDDPLTLNTQGCAGGITHYALLQDGVAKRSGFMSETFPGSYQAVLAPLSPVHGPASIAIVISCPSGAQQTIDFDLYIDPSGLVKTTSLVPVADATVSLFRADVLEGPFELVPDGSALMSPMNRSNPSLSDVNGHFGWDVVAGYYKVRASKAGCVSPVDPGLDYVESSVLTIPPAVMDLDLRLDCGGPEPTFTPTATSTATETSTPTLTPTTTVTPTLTSTPSITTISGLRTLLHDQYRRRQIKRSLYHTLDTMLLIADRLVQRGNERAAIAELLAFKQVVQRESGHLITAKAARQLIEATQQVILALR